MLVLCVKCVWFRYHEFVTQQNVKKIGAHVWLAIAILMLECLLCYR